MPLEAKEALKSPASPGNTKKSGRYREIRNIVLPKVFLHKNNQKLLLSFLPKVTLKALKSPW